MTRPRLTPADLEPLLPQWQAARDILRTHQLGANLDDLAALLTLKIIAITWSQIAPHLPHHTPAPEALMPDYIRMKDIPHDPHLTADDKLRLLAGLLIELGTAMMLNMFHGEAHGAELYKLHGGVVRYDNDGEPYVPKDAFTDPTATTPAEDSAAIILLAEEDWTDDHPDL